MKKHNLYWSDYFDGCNYQNKAAVSLLTFDKHLIQIDTGCPYTFINYDYALQTGIVTESYIHQTSNFSENELGHKFYFVPNYELKLENYSIILPKCYLELDKTKQHKEDRKTYWKNDINAKNIGYLGMDFFIEHGVVFDFQNNYLTLEHSLKEGSMFSLEKGYIFFTLTENNNTYKVLFDTGSSASGLILRQKFKEKYRSLNFEHQEIIRNDFLTSMEFAYWDTVISLGENQIFKEKIKIEFPEKSFQDYLFYHENYDAVLGLQFMRNKKITFDFSNGLYGVV